MQMGLQKSKLDRAAQNRDLRTLLRALEDDSQPIGQQHAAEAIADLLCSQVIPQLSAQLRKTNPEGRQRLAASLARLIALIDLGEVASQFPNLVAEDQMSVLRSLANAGGDPGNQAIRDGLASPDAETYGWAVVAQAERGDAAVFDRLEALIRNPPYELYAWPGWMAQALHAFESLLARLASELPVCRLRDLAALADLDKDVVAMDRYDPRNDVIHDTITVQYPRVREICQRELERRGESAG